MRARTRLARGGKRGLVCRRIQSVRWRRVALVGSSAKLLAATYDLLLECRPTRYDDLAEVDVGFKMVIDVRHLMEQAAESFGTRRGGDMCEEWEISINIGQTAISKWRFKRCDGERIDASTRARAL